MTESEQNARHSNLATFTRFKKFLLSPERDIRPQYIGCRGDSDIDAGVIGSIEGGSDGELALECSYECECDRGGVWQRACQCFIRVTHIGATRLSWMRES